MIKHSNIVYTLIFTLAIFSSCMRDDMQPISEFDTGNEGVFIVCEGNFMYGNASLSYYNKNTKSIENTVFLRANGIPLGDVAQSLTIYDKTAWITVNNSGKIFAIDVNTFKIKGVINGLTSPRYMLIISPTKAYVSDMYSKSIYIVNPLTYEITSQINIDDKSGNYYRHSSEQLIICDDYLYTNSWSYDDKILIINTLTDELTDSIQVLKQPRKMVLDKNKKLWVLCDGGYPGSDYSGDAGIIKINTNTNSIEQSFIFNTNSKPADLKINKSGDTIYYINNEVYRFEINETSLPQQPIILAENKNFYSIGIDPTNSDIYISDAVNYLQSGVVYRYSSSLQILDTLRLGIIPNSFVFK